MSARDRETIVILAPILWLFVAGLVGAYVGTEKRRGPAEGFWFGVFFGPFGWIVVGLLPTGPEPDRPAPKAVEPAEEYVVVKVDGVERTMTKRALAAFMDSAPEPPPLLAEPRTLI